MSIIKLLNNGQWNKPPVLTAARKLIVTGLTKLYPPTTLGKMADFANGTSYDVGQLTIGGTPIIRISNITDPLSNYITTSEQFDERFMVKPGDLLVSWSASFKTIIWPGPVGIRNQHIFTVTEKEKYHRGFLRHLIEAIFDEMQQQVVGMGMMHLRRNAFLNYIVPDPDWQSQKEVAEFLDWIEAGQKNPAPTLSPLLNEQRRIIARIEEIAGKVTEARQMRQETLEQVTSFISSLHVSLANGRLKPIGDILILDEIREDVTPGIPYPQVGMKGFGHGLFARETVDSLQTTYGTFNKLYEGAVVLSQVKGWEGAIAICGKEFAGKYVSPEYRTFRCIHSEAIPEYLAPLVATPWFWRQLASLTKGMGDRRERIRPEQFLALKMLMPTLAKQRQAVELFLKMDLVQSLQTSMSEDFDALLPAVLDRAFSGRL